MQLQLRVFQIQEAFCKAYRKYYDILSNNLLLCNMPASVPFVHYHKTNEEIYIILSGKGKAVVDGEDIELSAGDIVRIAPDGKRQFFAADDSEISYACIQVKAGSLEAYTADDAVIE